MKIKPLRETNVVWLKLNLTPKGEHTKPDARLRSVNSGNRSVLCHGCQVLFLNVRFLCGQCHSIFVHFFLRTALSKTWMGKCSHDFLSQTPQVRPKSAIYMPKWDDEHPCHFYMGVPQEDCVCRGTRNLKEWKGSRSGRIEVGTDIILGTLV